MKKTNLKRALPLFGLVLACMLHLPFSFGKSAVWNEDAAYRNAMNATAMHASLATTAAVIYQHLNLDELGLSEQAYTYAIQGLEKLKETGTITNDRIISIVDFTKSSAQKRLFVIDLEKEQLLFNTFVAHGQNSGLEYATRFSNNPESYQSSLGFYETSGTYNGKNGYSMQLIGLESGINDKADKRAIVMHGAPYVNESMAKTQGRIGRSWGCPAVAEKMNKPIIDKIKNGSCLFIYANNTKYLHTSRILNS